MILAVWLDSARQLLAEDRAAFRDKVVVDPSSPIGFDDRAQAIWTLPAGETSRSVNDAVLPTGADYLRAFGTLEADPRVEAIPREPHQAVLLHATDDDIATATVERLTRNVGFDPVKAGNLKEGTRRGSPRRPRSEPRSERTAPPGRRDLASVSHRPEEG